MKLKSFILAAVVMPLVAWAGPPMKTSSCSSTVTIRAPRGGAGVYLDETCETAYVLPPAYGSIELQGGPAEASPDDCTVVASLAKTRAQLAERLKRLSDTHGGQDDSGGSTIGRGGGLGGGNQNEQPTEQDLEKIKKESEEIRQMLTKLKEDSREFLTSEGWVAKIIYTLDHEGMTAEYARLNPRIRFLRLPLEKAYLSIAPKGEGLKESGSEALDYNVPGLNKMPDEEGTAPDNSVYFGTAMSGKVRFNTKSACLLMSKNGGRIPENMSASMLDRHMAANITYAYGLNVRRQYYAKYDFQKMFQHIATQTQTGGFLSTKAVNEVIQSNTSNSWFTFRATTDDTRYPNEILAQQLKAEMIDRVMGQIAIGTVPGAGSIPAPLTPGPKGADVAADGLKKCPYVYCQIAGYVLDFVSATFGSSQSVQKFISTVGSTSEERVDEQKTLRFIGTSTFKDRL